jgi:hypothetical protein
VLLAACSGGGAAPSPFELGEAGAGGEAGAAPTTTGSSPLPPTDPQHGGPCVDSEQCDDGLDCTDDDCDQAVARCRFTPVHARCNDGIYCDGVELCEPVTGCREGLPVTCNDDSTCTIDVCIEATRSCESRARDADGDGDPVHNCGGGDCLDTDPTVNSEAAEVCGNERDDDCDGNVDGSDCIQPAHDGCADPLRIDAPGSYDLSLVAAKQDFASSCVSGELWRDVAIALVVPDDSPDIDLTVITADGSVPALTLAERCTDPSSEQVCVLGDLDSTETVGLARTVLRGLAPDVYPLFVSREGQGSVRLEVRYRDPAPAPENESCDSPSELLPDQNQVVLLAGTAPDLDSACETGAGDLVYRFELAETSDVEIYAVALDDYGVPLLSLRAADCEALSSELACRQGTPANLFARALAPGTYYVAVGARGPTEVDLRLTLRPPSLPPPDQGCDSPPLLEPAQTLNLDLGRATDAVNAECLPGAPDATYALELDEATDVLLLARLSDGDFGAVSLGGIECSAGDRLACGTGDQSPVRARSNAVPAGSYRVMAESALGAPIGLTAFTRPAQTPVLVAFADTCDEAIVIPETGGRFLGNTANVEADYEASCDFASGAPGGAPEQMLALSLSRERRVVFDLGLSDFATMLAIREASSCPGPEIVRTCVPGYVDGRSFLDRVLPAGDYWVQIDGYDRSTGNWILDVFVADP